jgi:hypothetical protein
MQRLLTSVLATTAIQSWSHQQRQHASKSVINAGNQ